MGFQVEQVRRATTGGENVPLVPTTIELWADLFPSEFLPVLELPVKDLELLDVVSQIRHVLGEEDFIWRTGKGVNDIRGARRRAAGAKLTVKNGRDVFGIHRRVVRIVYFLAGGVSSGDRVNK